MLTATTATMTRTKRSLDTRFDDALHYWFSAGEIPGRRGMERKAAARRRLAALTLEACGISRRKQAWLRITEERRQFLAGRSWRANHGGCRVVVRFAPEPVLRSSVVVEPAGL